MTNADVIRECVLYRRESESETDGDIVRCTACPHYCKIKPGRVGICGVRYNRLGKLYLSVWAKPSAIHVDPMEKKPLYHFYPGQRILSLGTIGCNFKCSFCQNWQLSMERPSPKDIEESCFDLAGRELLTPKDVIAYCQRQDIRFIAATYNEPTIWFEYSLDLARLAKDHGIKYVYVSNGFTSTEQLEQLKDIISAINIDLKGFNDAVYRKVMHGSIEPVKNSIRCLYNSNVIVEVTTLVVPGLNDSPEELRAIADFIVSISPDIPWHVSAFHPDYQMQDRPPTSPQTIELALDIGKQAGLKYLYAGNVRLGRYTDTCCPKCKTILVKRPTSFFGEVAVDSLNGNRCAKCGETIYGCFA
ncbi:Pyruvate formate-lyase activating enzyme [Giardia muris]|uniref:Pyruvate formate-lyase activating enzyme n=1 Tax=Giardia muris TaxID=5742 RepID=A0A4Z1SRA2_GIAMU|nr:Pyruvate formate-lyase activating enzyme [Giardia muris]|eukprot:TNJ27495.1 Pyruvate formate-lyase activating enzyme [Giardia muris]